MNNEIVEFQGVFLSRFETEALNSIKTQISRDFEIVDKFYKKNRWASCIIEKNHIVGIYIDNCGLKSLPDDFGSLNKLKIINLNGNHLKKLPTSIGKLENLETLKLNGNSIEQLPVSIGNLRSLQNLDLDLNQLMYLPKTIGNLSNLKELNLYDTKLKKIPETFGNLHSLEILRLEYNQLETLPESFGDLNNLKELILNNNELRNLPESFGNLKSLEICYVSQNKLENLPDSIGELNNLKELEIYNNELKSLPESFGNLKSLEICYASQNKLNYLPDSIGNLVSLQTLSLDSNKLKKLPKTLTNLTALTSLSLGDNEIENLVDLIANGKLRLETLELTELQKKQYYESFPSVKLLLKEIEDSLNEIDCFLDKKNCPLNRIVQSDKFPVYYKRYQKDLEDKWFDFEDLWVWDEHPILFYQENHVIKELAIKNDSIGEYDVYYSDGPNINKYILSGHLNSLETLYLEACFSVKLSNLFRTLLSLKNIMITKIDANALPESMGRLKSLEIINFRDCRLEKIPITIGNLKQLKQLILDNNDIEVLPTSISELESLEVLSLERNRLNQFPEAISKVKTLKELYLDNNSFTELPETIGNLTNLEVLSLENIKIKTLPKSIGNLKRLQVLNLKNCNLISLPDSICQLKALTDLRIEGNFISEISEETTKSLLDLKAIPEADTRFLKLNKEHSKILNELENLINDKLTLVKNMNKRTQYASDTKSNEYIIENNKITALNIKLMNLYRKPDLKKIPRIICNLTDLRYLECRGRFTEIPKLFLENLPSLEILRLNIYLKEISNLEANKNLKNLDLSRNDITEIKGLDSLTNLTSLNLQRNKITKIQGLGNLLELKELNLAENKIPEIIGLESLTKLEKLDLTNNFITEIKGLENLENLKSISIKYGNYIPSKLINKIDRKGYGAAQKYVAYCQQRAATSPQERKRKGFLEWLKIQQRLPPKDNNEDLKMSLKDSILSFDFSNNSLKKLIELYDKLLKCLTFEELESFIYEKNSEAIYSIIKRIKLFGSGYKVLDIIKQIFINIDQEHFLKFFPELMKLKDKHTIQTHVYDYLYKQAINNLTDVEKATENLVKLKGVKIPEKEAIALYELERYLKTMKFNISLYGFFSDPNMHYCVYKNRVIEIEIPLFYYYYYSRSSITTLPNAICDFNALQTLIITSGKERISSLPDNIGDLTSLKHLILSGNSITNLPESVENLKELKVLDLSSNKFTRIPDLIAYLPSLEKLDITSNPLILDAKTKDLLERLRKKGLNVDHLLERLRKKDAKTKDLLERLRKKGLNVDHLLERLRKKELNVEPIMSDKMERILDKTQCKEFKVNKFVTLKLEEEKTNLYVNGVLFNSTYFRDSEIDPEIEFLGHCSDLKAWYELDYNTPILHSNLALPLLKRLANIGDSLAKKVLKEEIMKKMKSNNIGTLRYLRRERYLQFLSDEEKANSLDRHTYFRLFLKEFTIYVDWSYSVQKALEKIFETFRFKIEILKNLFDKLISNNLLAMAISDPNIDVIWLIIHKRNLYVKEMLKWIHAEEPDLFQENVSKICQRYKNTTLDYSVLFLLEYIDMKTCKEIFASVEIDQLRDLFKSFNTREELNLFDKFNKEFDEGISICYDKTYLKTLINSNNVKYFVQKYRYSFIDILEQCHKKLFLSMSMEEFHNYYSVLLYKKFPQEMASILLERFNSCTKDELESCLWGFQSIGLEKFFEIKNVEFFEIIFSKFKDLDNKNRHKAFYEYSFLLSIVEKTGLLIESLPALLEVNNKLRYFLKITAFADIIKKIKNTKLLTKFYSQIEAHFLTLFETIDKLPNSFIYLFTAIKGTPLLKNHISQIEANFLSILNNINEYRLFIYFIGTFEGYFLMEKYYPALVMAAKRVFMEDKKIPSIKNKDFLKYLEKEFH